MLKEGYADPKKKLAMKAMEFTLSSPFVYKNAGKAGRWFMKHAPFTVNNKLNLWYQHREMPQVPKESFGEWYKKNKKND